MTISKLIKYRLAFSTKKTPKFGRGAFNKSDPPLSVTESPFYWWFKFLQLNEEYQRAVKGEKNTIDRQVVMDFGDVSNIDFKTWWQSRAELFAEPRNDYEIKVATSLDDLAPFDRTDVINLVIPLNWTNVNIKRNVNKIIDTYVTKSKSRVDYVLNSEARYKLGRKWSIEGLQNAHRIYVGRQEADAEREITGKKTIWVDIAIKKGLPAAKGLKIERSTNATYEQRRNVTIQCDRLYKQAKQYIANSASHRFLK